MKQKFYSMHGVAVDRNGDKHMVTIVGEYVQEKVETCITKEINIKDERKEHKVLQGILTYPTTIKTRTLTYAVSICHPDDQFNKEVGIELAKRRIKKNPLGQLSTNLVTTLCEDQIKLILFGELNYVIDNIDKYIE